LPAEEVEVVRRTLTQSAGAEVAVWPANAAAVEAFLAAASQWRTSMELANGRLRTVFIGLDYCGAKVALDARAIEATGELWNGLTVMEMAARDALNSEVTA
jgi:hypothetical protein